VSVPTVADVERLLQAIGQPPAIDGMAFCPVCDYNCTSERALRISQNGVGAKLECGKGCTEPELHAALNAYAHALRAPTAEDALTQLRARLDNLPVERVVKRGAGDVYELHLADGRVVDLGDAYTIQQRQRFRAAIRGQAHHPLALVKPADHDRILDLIEQLAEHHEALSGTEEAAGWVEDFARGAAGGRAYDIEDSAALFDLLGAKPAAFRTSDGRLCLRLDELAKFVNRTGLARITARELSTRLGRLGFTKPDHGGQLAARKGGHVRSARYWIGPGQDGES